MTRDRLAAHRAQRQVQEAGAIEMQSVSHAPPSDHPYANGRPNDISTMSGFYAEVASIQDSISQFNANINTISDLHARSLNALSEQETAANTSQLSELTDSTRALSNELSTRIKALQTPVRGLNRNDAEIRKNRITLVHGKFVEALQKYQAVERQYRQRYRDRVERQFKIVKPDATPEEVSAVVNDTEGSGNSIFLQAISSSNRYGESRRVYREVQERHQDIQRIELTLAELAQLFNDMATLIDQQKDKVDNIETRAGEVNTETKRGTEQVGVAVGHARSARRKRWICFWLTVVIILAAVGIGVGVYFSQHPSSSSSSSSSSSTTATPSATTTT
ncbi:t-SNARE [Pisolithus croceorrhizus]|nr:t-SNARE [Pisolithus croceorrhizus]KAI6131814.1 t-SNARE [Pisolithus croceorrhizus]